MAASACNLTAKRFLGRRSRAWKKFLHPLNSGAASRAALLAVLRRTSRIRASLRCWRSSAAFPLPCFRRSPEFAAISAHRRAARPCMKLCAAPRRNRAASAGQFLWLRWVPACSSAVAGSLLTKIENKKWKLETLFKVRVACEFLATAASLDR